MGNDCKYTLKLPLIQSKRVAFQHVLYYHRCSTVLFFLVAVCSVFLPKLARFSKGLSLHDLEKSPVMGEGLNLLKMACTGSRCGYKVRTGGVCGFLVSQREIRFSKSVCYGVNMVYVNKMVYAL